MKKFSILALIAVFIIGIGIFASDILLQWLPFIGHTPEYGAKASAFFMAITALMTLLLAIATFNSTKQSKLREQERRKDNIEKETRDRKERLLNEIIDWAEDISIASLTPDISLMAKNITNIQLLTVERDVNTLMRYGISRSKETSILTILEERFKGELLELSKTVINKLVEVMYLK